MVAPSQIFCSSPSVFHPMSGAGCPFSLLLPSTDLMVRKLLFEAHFPHLTLLDPMQLGAKLTRPALSGRKTTWATYAIKHFLVVTWKRKKRDEINFSNVLFNIEKYHFDMSSRQKMLRYSILLFFLVLSIWNPGFILHPRCISIWKLNFQWKDSICI